MYLEAAMQGIIEASQITVLSVFYLLRRVFISEMKIMRERKQEGNRRLGRSIVWEDFIQASVVLSGALIISP